MLILTRRDNNNIRTLPHFVAHIRHFLYIPLTMKFEYSPDEVPQKVVEVLKRFCLHSSKDGHQKDVGRVFESVPEKLKVNITANQLITMVLPAFPWKSPNQDKVLGYGADLGEEMGLAKLNHLCEEISKVYPYGARLILICDGPVYNGMSFLISIQQ